MVDQQISHKHPDSELRINTLEVQVKKLQEQVEDIQLKLQTHDHPHSLLTAHH
jgi:chaperonin cofactor prefoldin